MYIEKDFLIKKIDEYCSLNNIKMSFDERYKFSTIISRKLDEHRILDFDTFVELLEHNEQLEQYSDIDFNDEIVSIECVGNIDMVDINVSGNKLFFANNILTHNSATNNIDEADNSNVSDSMGTVMTADFMMFLLQNEEMKERKEIVCKITKNRFTGKTDTWLMNIDYEHMRFSDQLIQNINNIEIDITNTISFGKQKITDDFSIVENQKKAEIFANKEIRDIVREDAQIVRNLDKNSDPFVSNIDALYKQLGI